MNLGQAKQCYISKREICFVYFLPLWMFVLLIPSTRELNNEYNASILLVQALLKWSRIRYLSCLACHSHHFVLWLRYISNSLWFRLAKKWWFKPSLEIAFMWTLPCTPPQISLRDHSSLLYICSWTNISHEICEFLSWTQFLKHVHLHTTLQSI